MDNLKLKFPSKGCALRSHHLHSAEALCAHIDGTHTNIIDQLSYEVSNQCTLIPCCQCNEPFHSKQAYYQRQDKKKHPQRIHIEVNSDCVNTQTPIRRGTMKGTKASRSLPLTHEHSHSRINLRRRRRRYRHLLLCHSLTSVVREDEE